METYSYSSILDWRISGTEEPGGLQSVGLQQLDRTEGLTLSLPFQVFIMTLGFNYLNPQGGSISTWCAWPFNKQFEISTNVSIFIRCRMNLSNAQQAKAHFI